MKTKETFDSFFQSIYESRWPELKEALKGQDRKVDAQLRSINSTYRLDIASQWVSDEIPFIEQGNYLDLCAAPGGKTLLAVERFCGKSFTWLANEVSKDRFFRMKALIDPYQKAFESTPSALTCHQWDGEKIGLYHKDVFDFILVDAPCSSERHLIEQQKTNSDWTVSRTKSLSKRQYSLLCSALLALKPGGQIFYSTCSISPFENDGVIERLKDRKSDLIEDESEFPEAPPHLDLKIEKTKFGAQCFPDQNEGAGPIYFAKIRKRGG